MGLFSDGQRLNGTKKSITVMNNGNLVFVNCSERMVNQPILLRSSEVWGHVLSENIEKIKPHMFYVVKN